MHVEALKNIRIQMFIIFFVEQELAIGKVTKSLHAVAASY